MGNTKKYFKIHFFELIIVISGICLFLKTKIIKLKIRNKWPRNPKKVRKNKKIPIFLQFLIGKLKE